MLEVAGEGSFLCFEQIAQNPANLGRQQVIKLGREVKLDALPGPLQGHTTNEQHHQDEVREGGGEVHDLQESRASWESWEREQSCPWDGTSHHPEELGSLGYSGAGGVSPAVSGCTSHLQIELCPAHIVYGSHFPRCAENCRH